MCVHAADFIQPCFLLRFVANRNHTQCARTFYINQNNQFPFSFVRFSIKNVLIEAEMPISETIYGKQMAEFNRCILCRWWLFLCSPAEVGTTNVQCLNVHCLRSCSIVCRHFNPNRFWGLHCSIKYSQSVSVYTTDRESNSLAILSGWHFVRIGREKRLEFSVSLLNVRMHLIAYANRTS